MLDAPVDIDGRDALGQTALWQACRDGFEDICALLLKRGASPEIAAHSGRLPREIAELHGHAAVIATFDEPVAPVRVEAVAAPPPAAPRAAPAAEPVPEKLGPRRALEGGFVRSPVFDD